MLHVRNCQRVCCLCFLPLLPSDVISIVLDDGSLPRPRFILSKGLCLSQPCFDCRIGPLAVSFHWECYLLAAKFNGSPFRTEEIWSLHHSLTSEAQMTDEERMKRARQAFKSSLRVHKDQLGQACKITHLSRLPSEIYEQIIDYLPWPCRLHAILVIATEMKAFQVLIGGEPTQSRESQSSRRSSTLQHITIAGTSYVLDFEHSPPLPDYDSRLFLISDGFGIVGMYTIETSQRATANGEPRAPYPLWYKVVSTEGIQPIKRKSRLLRDIESLGKQCPFWDCPLPPKVDPRSQCTLDANKGKPKFMRYTKLSKIAGIGVACYQGLIHLYSHHHATLPPTSTYKRVDSLVRQTLVWLYLPLEQEELICKIWFYRLRGNLNDRAPGILLWTTHERVMNFGAAILPQEVALYDIKQISGPPAQLLGLYLNDLGVKGSSEFSFGAAHERELQIHEEPWPLSTKFIGLPQKYAPGRWHYSEACLADCVKVEACFDFICHHSPCIGMLLTYHDGRRECLGQWRFDGLCRELWPSEDLFICAGRNTARQYIKDVSVTRPSSTVQHDGTWYSASLRNKDKISWWFTPTDSEVFIEKGTVPIEM